METPIDNQESGSRSFWFYFLLILFICAVIGILSTFNEFMEKYLQDKRKLPNHQIQSTSIENYQNNNQTQTRQNNPERTQRREIYQLIILMNVLCIVTILLI